MVTIDAAWAVGIALAVIRAAAFAAASPILAKVMPKMARGAFAVAVSLAIARPVTHVPGLGGLVGAAGVNLAVGLVLAFVSGLPFYAFDVAGSITEIGAGLSAAQVLDPAGSHTSGVLSGMFNMAALAILLAVGGDRVIVQGIARSVDVIPLLGVAKMPGDLAKMVVDSVGSLMVSGLELAAPVMAALFLADLGLAALARFSPQSNAFMIGLPAKILITFLLLGAAMAIFPGAVHQALDAMSGAFTGALHAMGS